MNYKFGFIGSGNMGSALASAICKKIDAKKVALCDKDEEKAKSAASLIGCICDSTENVVKESEYIFVAVKPQGLEALFAEIKPCLEKREERLVFITMAAGVSIERLNRFAGKDYPVIRIMPNTPVMSGEGMILYAPCEAVSDKELEDFVSALEFSGKLSRIDEKNIDAESIITGCGPAYVFMLIDAMAKAAVELGTEPEKAKIYAEQTFLGAAKLALDSGKDLDELKRNVCSPGGTTIEGVKSLEEDRIYDIMKDAVMASYTRTLELASGK